MPANRGETERTDGAGVGASAETLKVVQALRAGDEAAFASLVSRYHTAMIRLAMTYVSSVAVAEEVVQETWLAVLQGLDRFQGRSSLKTWIFSILTNRAKTRGERERRTVPLSSLGAPETEDASPSVDPERFLPGDHRWAGHWAHPPRRWDETVEERFVSRETVAYIHTVIATLPPTQRQVITLRDVEGWTSDEVCGLLGVTETNQRVLLHRARSRVRSALERYLSGE